MKRHRRLLLVAGVSALAIVGLAVALAFVVRDDDGLPRYPGRVAVRAGCGLHHTFFDGEDPQELCLPNLWAGANVSKNGKRIAWDTSNGLYIANEDGFAPTPIPAPRGANFDPSLSPDASKVAFLHSPLDDGRYDVWIGSTSADDAEQVTNTRNVSTVAWAPKGDRIAFVRGALDENDEGEIVLARTDGSDQRVLARGDSPSWSPDASQLTYSHGGGIWTIRADGSDAQEVYKDGDSPAWSRDGKMIAFMREVPCEKAVCDQRVVVGFSTGGETKAIGPKYEDAVSPIWLPDPFE